MIFRFHRLLVFLLDPARATLACRASLGQRTLCGLRTNITNITVVTEEGEIESFWFGNIDPPCWLVYLSRFHHTIEHHEHVGLWQFYGFSDF